MPGITSRFRNGFYYPEVMIDKQYPGQTGGDLFSHHAALADGPNALMAALKCLVISARRLPCRRVRPLPALR